VECACEFEADVDEICEALKDNIVIARKGHHCDECHDPILPGQKYRYETLVYEGRVFTHKTCLDCDSIRRHLCGCFQFGEIRQLVKEGIAQECIPSESQISRLTPAARGWVCEIVEELWEDEDAEL